MANYTDDQRDIIMQMPSAVLLGAMVADSGSKISSIHEFFAGGQYISSEAVNEFPGNQLIAYITKNANLPKIEEATKSMFSKDTSAAMAQYESKLDAGLSVLANDEEGNQFKAFLIKLGEVVVNSSSDGFFGTSGPRLNEKEKVFMDGLKQKLR